VLLAAGQGIISIDDVRRMVTEPNSVPMLPPEIYRVPSHGLYLANVEYDDEGLLNQMLINLYYYLP